MEFPLEWGGMIAHRPGVSVGETIARRAAEARRIPAADQIFARPDGDERSGPNQMFVMFRERIISGQEFS
jgi:hypothetical protein